MTTVNAIQLPPLTKRSLRELVAKARALGIEPGDYARQLIEEALAIQREAEASSFAQIMKPVREAVGDIDDDQIIRLVETARSEHHGRQKRKKR